MLSTAALQYLLLPLRFLLVSTPDTSAWAVTVIWIVRIVTLALLGRTYVVPNLVSLVSSRVRVRSVSLRSIRGLYLRTGRAVLTVDRIKLGWRWASDAKTVRMTVTVTGMKVDILERTVRKRRTRTAVHSYTRMPSLARINPTPIASYTWSQLPSFASFFQYFLRPALTTVARSILRLVILALPSLTQILELEFDEATLSSKAHLDATIVLTKTVMSSHLAFVQQVAAEDEKNMSLVTSTKTTTIGSRIRTLWDFATTPSRDHAWASTQCIITVALNIDNVLASVENTEASGQVMSGHSERRKLLQLPSGLSLRSNVDFLPSGFRIKEGGFGASLDISGVYICMEELNKMLTHFKAEDVAHTDALDSDDILSPSEWEHPPSPLTSPPAPSPSLALPTSPTATSTSSGRLRSMDPFSAFRRGARQMKLTTPKKARKPWLSYLGQVRVSIEDVTVVGIKPFPFQATVSSLTLSCGTSQPDPGTLHREALGKSASIVALPAYTLSFSVKQSNLARQASSGDGNQAAILHLGSTSLTCFFSDWPRQWLSRLSPPSHDPNDAFVAVRLLVSRIEATERLDLLQALLAEQDPKAFDAPTKLRGFPPAFKVPRMQCDVHIDEMSGILACTRPNEEWTGLTVGVTVPSITFCASSCFVSPGRTKGTKDIEDSVVAEAQLQMDFDASLNTGHVSIVVLSGGIATHGYAAPGHEDKSEPLLLMDPFEMTVHGAVQGHSAAGEDSGVFIDIPTAVVDMFCATDALSVELWHEDVLLAATALLSLAKRRPPSSHTTTSPRTPSSQLPFGLAIKFGVRRVTAFVTSPDLNPKDDMELSRGVAVRTSMSFSFCSLKQACLAYVPPFLLRNHYRQKLSVPEERIVPAVSAARATAVTNQDGAFAQLVLRQSFVRSASATPFAADDPYFEQEEQDHSPLLSAPLLVADVTLRSHRVAVGVPNICGINIHIPDITSTVKLSDIYGMMLANRRLQAIIPIPNDKKIAVHSAPRATSITCSVSLDSVQALLRLPFAQAVCIRGRDLQCNIPSSGQRTIRAGELFFLVPTPTDKLWHDLVRVKAGAVHMGQLPNASLKVMVDGACRIRVPHGYVFNELIRSIGTSVKAMRHLVHVVKTGQYYSMGYPTAEGPKSVPQVEFHLQIFVLEMVDDPLDSKLGLIWRAGVAASRIRMEREDAFEAKVQAINAENGIQASPLSTSHLADYRFDAKHSVPICDARDRLLQVHALDWMARFKQQQESREDMEASLRREIWGEDTTLDAPDFEPMVDLALPNIDPPLLRLMAQGVKLTISPPSFPITSLSDFLFTQGAGLPRDTQYSLLVPLHLHIQLSSTRLAIRDYPLPLFNIPQNQDPLRPSLEFDTDLVIAEEMGGPDSVEWLDCDIVEENSGVLGSYPLSVRVPKTIMPVKTYATPIIRVHGGGIADFAWGVSYAAVTQDIMRVVDTLSSPPRDPSPPVGFWDKLRLQMHWKAQVVFDDTAEVHMHMKGSRDPYEVIGHGAGFVICWSGNPRLKLGYDNPEKQFLQVESKEMIFAIPDLQSHDPRTSHDHDDISIESCRLASRKYRKICAKLGGGVKFGIGAAFERACGTECNNCSGSAFHRVCRYFDFIPHYKVRLGHKDGAPEARSPEDSYNGFRSDYLHMSISLSSSLRKASHQPSYSSFHLSPQMFSQFWAWCALFDRRMSLPIRQGTIWPSRTKSPSPKIGRHIATLKYSVAVPDLFISHVYTDNSRDAWGDGVTPMVGLKARIDSFQADLHQREEETLVAGLTPGSTRVIRRKAINSAEVVMKRLELRVMLADFTDPLKRSVPMEAFTHSSNYRNHPNMPKTDPDSEWVDTDDFVDVDWAPSGLQAIHVLRAAFCPRFRYFKHKQNGGDLGKRPQAETSKFGNEDSHVCFMGKDASVWQVQIELALARIQAMRSKWAKAGKRQRQNGSSQSEDAKQIALLEAYVEQLRKEDVEDDEDDDRHSYYMPAHAVKPEEWADFDNVYQVHNPEIYMSNAVRDILVQYYYCSRARRGFEYHMATRAVKFIRDQAEVLLDSANSERKTTFGGLIGAHHVAHAFKKMLDPNSRPNPRISVFMQGDNRESPQVAATSRSDPLDGWSDGVTLQRSHFCLMLKPQIVLQCDANDASVCVLAAVQATSRAYAIMDDLNADDPVNGKIMTRSYTALSGLQMFSPSSTKMTGDHCVPLEVFVDLRCESQNFDRVIPQTDATFHYDKFNRLRLRNKKESVLPTATDESTHSHLQHQMDLVRVDVPRFVVGATDRHLQAISDVITDLVLFSDAAHKARAEKLEKMLFSYDFTDLLSAASVISDMQGRLRYVVESERLQQTQLLEAGDAGRLELLNLKARALSLSEELNLIFDAIKLAQDKADDHGDRKSALMLRATSGDIAWRMLDKESGLLAKLAMRKIEFSWLSRTDSTTISRLTLGDLRAENPDPQAMWAEMLSRTDGQVHDYIAERGWFLYTEWKLVAPVGGISIYEYFHVNMHPMRLQIETRMGSRLMEYVWPERRRRKQVSDSPTTPAPSRQRRITEAVMDSRPPPGGRASMEAPRSAEGGKSFDVARLAVPQLRRNGTSRSFTDLRSASRDQRERAPDLARNMSSYAFPMVPTPSGESQQNGSALDKERARGEADEMKSRSAQKTFVDVRIESLDLLLSVWKANSFACQDARIHTRVLEWKNRTCSFEELVEQFIPSNSSWTGWVKMALHQPLVPVFPVARELFSKTKFMARKGGQMSELQDGSAPRRSLQGARRDGNTAMPPSRPSTPNLAGEHIVRTMTPEPIESRNRIMRLLKRPKKNADPQESQEAVSSIPTSSNISSDRLSDSSKSRSSA